MLQAPVMFSGCRQNAPFRLESGYAWPQAHNGPGGHCWLLGAEEEDKQAAFKGCWEVPLLSGLQPFYLYLGSQWAAQPAGCILALGPVPAEDSAWLGFSNYSTSQAR